MKFFMDSSKKLAQVMHWISGVLLVVMMLTVLVDVVTRTIFGMSSGEVDITFTGGVEIVKYGLLFTIMFALPYSVRRGQVIVDIFTDKMSVKLKGILAGIYSLGFAALGVGMTYRFYHSIFRYMKSGETTQDLIIPLYYFLIIATFAAGVLAIRALFVAIQQFIDSGRA